MFCGALATTGAAALAGCHRDPPPPLPQGNYQVLSEDQLAEYLRDDKEVPNNSYVPGVGYYHSVHHAWFPYPFNYYYPGYGYYRGGRWNDDNWNGAVPPASRPNWSTVTRVPPGAAGHGYYYGGRGLGPFSHGAEAGGISRGVFTTAHGAGEGHGFGGGHSSGS